ncbi:MAG TPA: hypothetical protein DEA96_06115 [Leptospiraceae bacterium]|nr:hypothetical protein [Spirochaetaceae bacterium]HBS04518.1 hypothetical protein [Leptospiraceae bacterium]|tara:strand:+ start:128037 stop:128801 length:765 start_codon:yes stop_codon:yes gene_type:complete
MADNVNIMKRLLSLSLVCILSLGMANCFQIMNYLQFNQDGSLDVTWRFTISKSLANASEKSGESDGKDFETEMAQGRKEIEDQLKNRVKDLKVDVISTEYDAGMMIRFSVPDIKKMPDLSQKVGDDKLPAFPVYDPKTHSLKVTFEQDKKEKPENPAAAADAEIAGDPAGEPGNPEGSESSDQMGKELAQMILSSARYQVFISGEVPVKASAKGSEEKEIEIVKLGNSYLIDYPFMSSVVAEEQDIDLVIQLKK